MGRLVEDKVNRSLAAAGSIPVGSLGSSAVVDLDSLVADKASLKVQRKQIVCVGKRGLIYLLEGGYGGPGGG